MFDGLKCKLGLHDAKDIGGGNQICGRCGVTRSTGCGVSKWRAEGRHWAAQINLPREEIQAIEDYLKVSYDDRGTSPLKIALTFPNGRQGWVTVSFGCSASTASIYFDLEGSFSAASTQDVTQRLSISDIKDRYSVRIEELWKPEDPRIQYATYQEA